MKMVCVFVCVEREREIYFKELAHKMPGLASPKSVGQSSGLAVQARVDAVRSLEVKFPLLQEIPVFALKAFQLFTCDPHTFSRVIFIKVY